MPNGFQITQQELPIARKGYVDFFMKKTGELDAEFTESDRRRVRIKQLQMEMDSGKIVHTADNNLVDLNRAGIGLIEIVTEPELSSPTEAAYFVEHLRLMLLHNQICQGEMHSKLMGALNNFLYFRWSIAYRCERFNFS
jgi:aspartyl-tRNA(Asn)/glutamyl-tRNA(Gln) amidotransferase subunit B